MEDKIISARIRKDVHKGVVKFCLNERVKIKHFIEEAMLNELILRDKENKYVPKSTKSK